MRHHVDLLSAKVGNEKNKPVSQPRPKQKNNLQIGTNYDISPSEQQSCEAGQGGTYSPKRSELCVLSLLLMNQVQGQMNF